MKCRLTGHLFFPVIYVTDTAITWTLFCKWLRQ